MEKTPPKPQKSVVIKDKFLFFLDKKQRAQLSRLKRRVFKHVWLVRFVILFCVGLLFFGAYKGVVSYLNSSGASYYISLASDFVRKPSEKIESLDGRTNILILGKGGAGHEAPDLTDTMMFASLDHATNKITLISFPRDIWIPELRAKLNSAYYWGNQKQEGGGIILAKSVVEEIVGQPIQYVLVADFSVFNQVIGELGGITVDVETGFTDEKYPVKGKEADFCDGDPTFACRYETVTFEAGRQYMDSERALKYVRSRNAEGDEGTDFARSARQQRVIAGIKEKVMQKEILFSFDKIKRLVEIGQNNVETTIDPSAAAIMARIGYDGQDTINRNVLPEELLVNPPLLPQYDNLYVFIPASEDGSWDNVHAWVSCTLAGRSDCLPTEPNTTE